MKTQSFKRLTGIFTIPALCMVFLLSCLDPIEYNPDFSRIHVSGDINAYIIDSAVLWVENMTQSVDVSNLRVDRKDLHKEYPKDYEGPKNGASLASYHSPTDVFFLITLDFKASENAAPQSDYKAAPGDASEFEGRRTARIQMPRAQDYIYFLYRDAVTGQITLKPGDRNNQPHDNIDKANPPLPLGQDDKRSPLIVKNLTKDTVINSIEFTAGKTSLTYGNSIPSADSCLFYLRENSYQTVVNYTKAGVKGLTTPINIHVIGSTNPQSIHTLYAYFYEGVNGDHILIQEWPPGPLSIQPKNPADPSQIGSDQGSLLVINRSKMEKTITKIYWGTVDYDVWVKDKSSGKGTEIPVYIHADTIGEDSNSWRVPLAAGTGLLRFTVEGNDHYGSIITNIKIDPRKVTKVEYVDGMENDNYVPPASGVIRITNKTTTHWVTGVKVIEANNRSNNTYIDCENFLPYGGAISRNVTSRAIVQAVYEPDGFGNPTSVKQFDLKSGQYIVQIVMDSDASSNEVKVERRETLLNRIIDITIDNDDISTNVSGGLNPATIAIVNSTTTADVVNATLSFANNDNGYGNFMISCDDFTPSGEILRNGKRGSFEFMSTTSLPLLSGHEYSIGITLLHTTGYYTVVFNRVLTAGKSYTLTVTDNDLNKLLSGTPVNNLNISLASNVNTLVLFEKGTPISSTLDTAKARRDFTVQVYPQNANYTSINWKVSSGLTDSVAVTNNNGTAGTVTIFNYYGGAAPIQANIYHKKVVVTATVMNGAVPVLTKDFEFLVFHRDANVNWPSLPLSIDLTLGAGGYTIEVGQTRTLSGILYSYDYLTSGIKTSTTGITWSLDNPQTASNPGTVSGLPNDTGTITGVTPGFVKMKATANSPALGITISETFTIQVIPKPGTDAVYLIMRRAPRTGEPWEYIDTVEMLKAPRKNYTSSQIASGDSGQYYNIRQDDWMTVDSKQAPEYMWRQGATSNKGGSVYPVGSVPFGLIKWEPGDTETLRRQQQLWENNYSVLQIPDNGADDVYLMRWSEHDRYWRGGSLKGSFLTGQWSWFIIDVGTQKRAARNADGTVAYYYIMIDINPITAVEASYFTATADVPTLKDYTGAPNSGQKTIWKIQGPDNGNPLLNAGNNAVYYSDNGTKAGKMPFPNGIMPN